MSAKNATHSSKNISKPFASSKVCQMNHSPNPNSDCTAETYEVVFQAEVDRLYILRAACSLVVSYQTSDLKCLFKLPTKVKPV